MTDSPNPEETRENPDLSLPPHMLPQLFELLAGGWVPDTAQQQELEAHLLTCSWCRVALLYLLSVAEEADWQTGADAHAAHALLERWADLHRRLEAVTAEAIPTEDEARAEPREEEES